jgi:hypothetical protein
MLNVLRQRRGEKHVLLLKRILKGIFIIYAMSIKDFLLKEGYIGFLRGTSDDPRRINKSKV